MKNKKIAVVMGGPTTEREVSLNTGAAVLAALAEKGYHAKAIDLNPAVLVDELKFNQIDLVFNAIHGQYGEDGLLQGLLEFLSIDYTGSGVLASAAAMDKAISKHLFSAAGIPTAHSGIYYKKDFFDAEGMSKEIIGKFGLPVVVKPNAQGSSIGVSIAEGEGELQAALNTAFQYNGQILLEKFIQGRELTVSILGNTAPNALPIIEIIPSSGRYDYHSKYTQGATNYLVPAPLDIDTTKRVQNVALETYKLLLCRGVGRVDIILGQDGVPYVLEVNTMPGMTATSLVPKAAAAAGISFPDLCERILFLALEK